MASKNTSLRKRALVIGINTYTRNPLDFCINDVGDLNVTLKSIGFAVTSEINLKLEEFTKLFKAFFYQTQPEDLILFYFAGHAISCGTNDSIARYGPRPTPRELTESDFVFPREQLENQQRDPKSSINVDDVRNRSRNPSVVHHKPNSVSIPVRDNPVNQPRDNAQDFKQKNKLAGSVSLPRKLGSQIPKSPEAHFERSEVLKNAFHADEELSPRRTPRAAYPSQIFGIDKHTRKDVRDLLEYLGHNLPIMNKHGPMSGQCIPETDQMENFLRQNFGFRNIEGKYIVSGVRAFEIRTPVQKMNLTTKIYFPDKQSNAFVMIVDEILKWQSSFAVYADRTIQGMDKGFLYQALQGKSKNGNEAFRMKFVVRISDCPILMKFDAEILSRSLADNWPNLIKLVSVTGIDFAGRKHDVDDITTYITNWREVLEVDRSTGMPAVFHGRDFYPLRSHPPVKLDTKHVFDDLMKMVRIRLRACDMEKVQIVVETGIGLGVFAGKHLGIDDQIRKLSAYAARYVLQKEGSTFTNIRAIVFALPIFSKDSSGHRLPDTYDDFVNEFSTNNYSGPIPVLIVDQDMHELTVIIAGQGFRVSQLNPADSHGVFGEYWQNHGPAVEEKLALTTLGLLVQHHLINPCVLDPNRYNLI
ncbi:unnamed protein product [Rotaria sp. Silwood2]|nr:unnamed protein product [Rotaria sp. Silwood2]